MIELEYKEKVLEYLKNKYPNNIFSFSKNLTLQTNLENGFSVDLDSIFEKSAETNFTQWELELFSFIMMKKAVFRIKNNISSKNKSEIVITSYLNACRNKIFPLLRTKEFIEHNHVTINKPFFDNIYICWAIDQQSLFQYVTNLDLSTWGISIDELDNISRNNIEASPQTRQLRVAKDPDTQLVDSMWWESTDGLIASRILIRNFYDFISESLGEQFFVSIPERNFLIMYRIGGNIDNLKKDTEKIYNKSKYPLFNKVILVDKDSFSFVG